MRVGGCLIPMTCGLGDYVMPAAYCLGIVASRQQDIKQFVNNHTDIPRTYFPRAYFPHTDSSYITCYYRK
jgi:hypothetical protein